MIIPVRCMNCGKLLADKYDYFQAKLREARGGKEGAAAPEPLCLDGMTIPLTAESVIFKALDLRRYCCRKTINTHIDLIRKL